MQTRKHINFFKATILALLLLAAPTSHANNTPPTDKQKEKIQDLLQLVTKNASEPVQKTKIKWEKSKTGFSTVAPTFSTSNTNSPSPTPTSPSSPTPWDGTPHTPTPPTNTPPPPSDVFVTLVAGPGGTVSGGGRVPQFSNVTIHATPNFGYSFNQWKSTSGVNLVPYPAPFYRTYTIVASDNGTIEASFSQLPTVLPSPQPSPSTSPTPGNIPPTITSPDQITLELKNSGNFSYQITTDNPPGTSIDGYGIQNFPQGLWVDPSTGLIRGYPYTNPSPKKYKGLLVVRYNGDKKVTKEVTLNVILGELKQDPPNPYPIVTSPGTAYGLFIPNEESPLFSYQITTELPETIQPLKVTGYSATGLPPGIEIDPKTGLISGQPTTAGEYYVTPFIYSAYGTEPNIKENKISFYLKIIIKKYSKPITLETLEITSPEVLYTFPNEPFTYTITTNADGEDITKTHGTVLPYGVTYNKATSTLSGSLSNPGDYGIVLATTLNPLIEPVSWKGKGLRIHVAPFQNEEKEFIKQRTSPEKFLPLSFQPLPLFPALTTNADLQNPWYLEDFDPNYLAVYSFGKPKQLSNSVAAVTMVIDNRPNPYRPPEEQASLTFHLDTHTLNPDGTIKTNQHTMSVEYRGPSLSNLTYMPTQPPQEDWTGPDFLNFYDYIRVLSPEKFEKDLENQEYSPYK